MRFSEKIEHLEAKPGVYLMLDSNAVPIYIGKAKDLKKRLGQYFKKAPSSHRTRIMLSFVDDLKVMITQTESEALVLEERLIKQHQPRYNVLLKDDKSFSYLVFSEHDFPRLQLTRMRGKKKDKAYGPYVNTAQAKVALDQIQRVFQIRNCADHFFNNRTRPCIQYEIGRCTAPCVGKINKSAYRKDVNDARRFLNGDMASYQDSLMDRMNRYAKEEAFEQAAACRDLLQLLSNQPGLVSHEKSCDVFYSQVLDTQVCVVLLNIVSGQMVHADTLIIDREGKHVDDDWLGHYVYNHYQTFAKPHLVLLPEKSPGVLSQALGDVDVDDLSKTKYDNWRTLAKQNMSAYLQSQASALYQWPDFWLALTTYLSREVGQILCIDVSHNQGSSAYASVVTCQKNGMDKSKYRTYKVSPGGDDCGAIGECMTKLLKAGRVDNDTLLVIDGGIGQINAANAVLESFGVTCYLTSISKGPKRLWGEERFYRYAEGSASLFKWPQELLKYFLYIRDQAHNVALRQHRQSLRKAATQSILDGVVGVGKDKKKRILGYFGGLEGLRCAKLSEIEKVSGIGSELAKRIYDTLHIDLEDR